MKFERILNTPLRIDQKEFSNLHAFIKPMENPPRFCMANKWFHKLKPYPDYLFFISTYTLREKCPNTEFFLVRVLPHLDWIRIQSESGKIRTRKTLYLDNFHAVIDSFNGWFYCQLFNENIFSCISKKKPNTYWRHW